MATYVYPTTGRISSVVGPRSAPTAGASSNHAGIDIAAPRGTSVVSVTNGIVVSAGRATGFGPNYVEIRNSDGTTSRYGHMSARNVEPGDKVTAGQQIGAVGDLGDDRYGRKVSSGNHLHYERRGSDGSNLTGSEPFGDNSDMNSSVKKGNKVTGGTDASGKKPDGSETTEDGKKKEGDQDGNKEKKEDNEKKGKDKEPQKPEDKKDIKGKPGEYEKKTTKSITSRMPSHEPWSGHPVSCKPMREGVEGNETAGNGEGSSGQGSSGRGNGNGTSTPGSGEGGNTSGQGTGANVTKPIPYDGSTLIKGMNQEQTSDYLNRLGNRESGNNYGSRNQYGFSGRFQFGTAALTTVGLMTRGSNANSAQYNSDRWNGPLAQRLGVTSYADWIANKGGVQEQAAIGLANANINQLSKSGKINMSDPNDVAGAAAASHLLGAGAYRPGGSTGTDANGTTGKSYYNMMGQIGTKAPKKKPVETADPGANKGDEKGKTNQNNESRTPSGSGSNNSSSSTPSASSSPSTPAVSTNNQASTSSGPQYGSSGTGRGSDPGV